MEPETNVKQERTRNINRAVEYLTHAYYCLNISPNLCPDQRCLRMTRLVLHVRNANHYSSCRLCKQYFNLLIFHAKHCPKSDCLVPRCASLKKKLKKMEHRQRLEKRKLRHEFERMNTNLSDVEQFNTLVITIDHSMIMEVLPRVDFSSENNFVVPDCNLEISEEFQEDMEVPELIEREIFIYARAWLKLCPPSA